MIQPLLQDDAFLADLAAAGADSARLHLWWLGQSGFLVQWQGHRAILDPYLSDSLTNKYASTDKPHVRLSHRVIDPARLTDIDVASSSHNHTDHLDAETLVPLLRANPAMRIIVPEANRAFVADRLKVDAASLMGIDDGASVRVPPFVFHGLPAAHDAIEVDAAGRQKYMGYVVECLAPGGSEAASGSKFIYHSGDTLLYDGLAERLRRFRIDVALLPINGRGPERSVAGNLWGREAARLAKEIGAGIVIPCHYDMFEFNTATPVEFVAECERIGQRCVVLRQGERLSI